MKTLRIKRNLTQRCKDAKPQRKEEKQEGEHEEKLGWETDLSFLPPSSSLTSFFFLLSSLRLRAFAPLRFFLLAFFSSRVFSSSQPRQEQQPEPGTFGV
jgi:hypothetical protein